MKDLIVLCADKNMQACLLGVLPRFKDVFPETRAFSFDPPYVHAGHDGGVRTNSHLFLRPFLNQYRHALVVMDFEGSGTKWTNRFDLEVEIEGNLNQNGWANRATAIVIEPELENWMWTNSPHMAKAINWEGLSEIEAWLIQNNLKKHGDLKPFHPKEAMEAALRLKKKPLSSSIHQLIAEKSSFINCTDSAFLKLVETIKRWFPKEEKPQNEQISLLNF